MMRQQTSNPSQSRWRIPGVHRQINQDRTPGFLRAATNPDTEVTQRSALVAREVEKVIPARDDADPWRATNRVWTAITHLTVRRRDARIYGVPMRDTYYNILRFGSVRFIDVP
jgi:hypothetical protein